MSMGAAALVPLPAVPKSPHTTGRRHIANLAYRFFNGAEAQFIEAACDRLIPADASGPGAVGAGVPYYLDEHLAGSWGAGLLLYRSSGWQPGSPLRLPFTPAELFHRALGAINREFGMRGIQFGALPPMAQERFLAALERGDVQLGDVPAGRFFELLLAITVEGFFSSPQGSTRDRVAWRLGGFPGAYAMNNPRPAVALRADSGLVSRGLI